MTDTYIVAEVSKNWIAGGEETPGSGLLCQQFERVIEHNRERGYRLVSFQLHRLMTGRVEMNETIIAVFERLNDDDIKAAVCTCGHTRRLHTAWGSCMATDCSCTMFTFAANGHE